MPQSKICRTVCQYNKEPITQEHMGKLLEIAEDCRKVKNYVYQRYGSVNSLSKLYPGYSIQNEMTESGFRTELGLPSVYFYLAVFDALGDIKSQWTHVKRKALRCICKNEELSPEDRHYLRFVMKQSQCFEGILMGKPIELSGDWEKQYEERKELVDAVRLDHYLNRIVRRYLCRLHTDRADGFSIGERAYRYENHGIYISIKEKRKRIFIPLTDNNRYKKQLYIKLLPEEKSLIIHVPVESTVKYREEYCREVGLAFGLVNMFVTDEGHVYGKDFGEYQFALADHVRNGNARYSQNKRNNSGRKKYYAQKQRLEATLHTYINREINQLLEIEKPRQIYIPKLPASSRAGVNKVYNHAVSMWQKGYVKERLTQKCQEQSIRLIEVWGKNISSECSQCGASGKKMKDIFSCDTCGLELPERINTARNVLKRGKETKT